jgi:hypothetical protein
MTVLSNKLRMECCNYMDKDSEGIMRCKLFLMIGITFIGVIIITREASAYLDLGTGSYIFQLFIAFIIGGLYAVKLFWKRIFFFIRNVFRKK